ncbi:PadR family transcriptional regulator [Nocardioides sp. cx-173]|uniref:PadR family transcriptional regulator n=1 Tax=Nocardioides sp. cx-173 TaxID=2898796 RepID=UPI001E3F9BBA|nr:PadR family transcriptional regulator [Nocardioides sp. cx-173]MCD4523812.1 PadR family transcriptional regulator [Nocardioides sp. cx-173]UGB41867.1 PadR family transcriptional regulator [Nocardioides sp. cx-173]
MGHPRRNRQERRSNDRFSEWAEGPQGPWEQHRGRGHGGPEGHRGGWAGGGWGGRSGLQGPPWLAGLFGLGEPDDRRRGPRVRRGDVRSAILDVLREAGEAEQPVNGYQVIQAIAEKSDDAWRPSPGSVYPTIQQLEDEGLVETDDERGRRSLRLTAEGARYVAEHAAELTAVWAPFRRDEPTDGAVEGSADIKSEIGQVMGAVWQIVSAGSEGQRRAAVGVLVETRRKLYGILADGTEPDDGPEDEDDAVT